MVCDRPDDAVGHLRFGHRPVVVNRGDHNVDTLECFIREIEASVFQDVHFDSREDRDVVTIGVDALDLAPLFLHGFVVEPVRHRHAFRVIGDRDIVVADLGRGGGHLADRILTIGRGRVHVQVAPNVVGFDQRWKRPLARRLNLAAVLAKLGWNERKIDRREGPTPRSSPAICSSPRCTPYSLIFRPWSCARRRVAILCSLLPVK